MSEKPAERPRQRGVFELDRLVNYNTDAVLQEMRRAIVMITAPVVTQAAFDRVARVSSSTCVRRFGGWQQALAAAGEADRYGGLVVTPKMTGQTGRELSDQQVASELKRVADSLGKTTLTRNELRRHSSVISDGIAVKRFGSWTAALTAAGLTTVPLGRRWTDEDYFNNLLTVWTHHGRAPHFAELNEPPSTISKGSYARKFGSWGAAKVAFLDRVTKDIDSEPGIAVPQRSMIRPEAAERPPAAEQRSVRLGLRYTVLRRDHFRCSRCGRSPATHRGCVLHVDHIHPFSRGGKTVLENLRTLCEDCNLGKGSRVEPDAEDASSPS